MKRLAFWNNKGGTGKTTLAFQAICAKALRDPEETILVVDLCPQANLSELFLGGLEGGGGSNLEQLHSTNGRPSIGGYFQARLPSPYTMPPLKSSAYIVQPSSFNARIPANIHLVCGDGLIELQSNAIGTLANAQIPGTNTWIAVADWLRDFLSQCGNYDYVVVDTNPSFSFYTQIALAATDGIVIPVMADDSSRRAVRNVLALVHDIAPMNQAYSGHTFASRLQAESRIPPRVHLLVKNRLTQYMGPASAYAGVLHSIDSMVDNLLGSNGSIFSFADLRSGTVDIRDFGSTGVVAHALGSPFASMKPGIYQMQSKDVQISKEYLQLCVDSIGQLANRLWP